MGSISRTQALDILKRCVNFANYGERNDAPNAVPLVITRDDGSIVRVSELSSGGRNIAAHFMQAAPELQARLLAMTPQQIDDEFSQWPEHDREGLKLFISETKELRVQLAEAKKKAAHALENIAKIAIRKSDLLKLGLRVSDLEQQSGLVISSEILVVMDKKELESLAGMTYENARTQFAKDIGIK